MKFVSKNANLRIVLSPGLSAQPLSGIPAKPAKYVKFEDGIVVVNDEKTCQEMMSHPAFNSDFIVADEMSAVINRQSSEPLHEITELKFGTSVGKINQRPPLAPEIQAEIQRIAIEAAKEMTKEAAPKIAMEILKSLADQQGKAKTKGGAGKKLKEADTPPVVEETPAKTE